MPTDPSPADVRTRLEQLEQRVAALESAAASTDAAADQAPAADPDDRFWALHALRRLVPGDGGVLFAGTVETADGRAEWQWGRTTGDLLDADWTAHAAALGALGHPVRLALLQAVVQGTRTVAELTAREDTGTSGQVYHHLRQLVAAGWLRHHGGRYQVPAERVVPLLTVLAASER
ncbi:helix-turn-helix domain-containing protein [Cellulomonas telluris]|uniref:helix-turn-helix domain-containing protein n=1 Tax=Cellulomonas telluris TaxID=2306636 RepID=UPI0010A8FCE6|nr:helix-turn-helix domain-containing protein [Cellulomonas telluris]